MRHCCWSLYDLLLYSCHDLLRSQLIVLRQLLVVITVVKTLLDTEAERLHVAIAIVLATAFNLRLTCLDVERHAPVPRLLVLLGWCIALTFLGMDMNHDRMVDVLYFLECFYQSLHVIAIGYILIVQALLSRFKIPSRIS